MPVELAERYGWMAECLDMPTRLPLPTVIFAESIPCPTSGRPCLASDGFFPCPSNPSKQCGNAGKTSSCGTIIMPDAEDGDRVFEHEATHWLRWLNTGDLDGGHSDDRLWREDMPRCRDSFPN